MPGDARVCIHTRRPTLSPNKNTTKNMITIFIACAIAGGLIGFGFGGCMSYNRGFSDGWEFSDDWHRRRDIIPPGSIVTEENGWTKTDGPQSTAP
jgi:uncharacterized membrane-anchored protein YitT (DUF2179 family)